MLKYQIFCLFCDCYITAKKLKLQQIGSFRILNGKVDLSTHEYQLTLEEWETKLANLREQTNVKYITKEINVAKTVQTVKVLAYKNGEGRLRPGEIICGSSITGVGFSEQQMRWVFDDNLGITIHISPLKHVVGIY